MLDTLLSRLKEEIAIDGTTGSSIDSVWKYTEKILQNIAKQSDVSIKPTIDAQYKSFLWNYIKQESELGFYEETGQSFAAEASLNINQNNVSMKEGENNQDQVDQEPIQGETSVSMETDSVIDETNNAQEPEPDEEVTHMLLDATDKEKDQQKYVGVKRKSVPTKKAPVKRKSKSKPKPKKKRPIKKKRKAAGSDDDFEMDSDTESEFEASDLSAASSEDDNEEFITDEDDDDEFNNGDFIRNYSQKSKPADKLSHPKFVQEQSTDDKANLKVIENIVDLSYEQAQKLFDSRLRIIASDRLQQEQLYIGIPPNVAMSPTLNVILKAILKTRTKGLYQASITKLLSIDSRSTGHYAKSLEEKGAITRSGVSINRMFTNICIHARYSLEANTVDMNTVGENENENEVPYNVNVNGKAFSQKALLHAMVDLAIAAPNGMILAQDILHGLGFDSSKATVRKWFNRSIDEICMKGYFEKASIKLNGNRFHRCLHLLKTPEDYDEKENELPAIPVNEIVFPIKIKNTKNHDIPIHHLLCDVPVDTQCLEVLAAAGTSGATQKDILVALNMDETRIASKILERLVNLKKGQGFEHYGVVRYLEFEGRIKRYRYFTLAASIKVNENIDYIPPPLPVTEWNESKLYERTIFIDLPHIWEDLYRYRRHVKRRGDNRNISYQDLEVDPPKFNKPKILLNPDGTPRKKSKYLINKERKVAEAAAAAARAEAAAARAAAGITDTPEASVSGTTNPQDPNVPIHSFFESITKPKRGRKPLNKPASKPVNKPKILGPPSPDPVPAPVLTGTVLSCPALVGFKLPKSSRPGERTKEKPSASDEPALKKRKSDRTAVITSDPVPETDRVTRSGKVITSNQANADGTESEPESITEEVESEPESSRPGKRAKKKPSVSDEPAIKKRKSKRATVIIGDPVPETDRVTRSGKVIASNQANADVTESEPEPIAEEVESEPTIEVPASELTFEPNEAAVTEPTILIEPESDNLLKRALSESVALNKPTAILSLESNDSMAKNVPESIVETSTKDTSESADTETTQSVHKTKHKNTNVVVKIEALPRGSIKKRSIADYFSRITKPAPAKTKVTKATKTTRTSKAVESTPTPTPEAEASPNTEADAQLASQHEKPANTEASVQPKPLVSQPENDVVDEETTTAEATEVEEINKQPAAINTEPESRNVTNAIANAHILDKRILGNVPSILTRSNNSDNSTSKYLFRHTNSQKEVNSYLEARVRVLYEYLEEVRIVEMGKIFAEEFTKRAAAQNKSSKYTIDSRTLWNTALELEKRGQAHTEIVSCPLINGKTYSRKIVFHRDISKDSSTFKDFVIYIKERRSLNQLRKLPKRVEEASQPVIRLSDQVQIMQKEAKELLENGQTKKAKQLEHRINELSSNLETFGRKYNADVHTYWMIEAIQYGWISARMIRAKVFHKFLYRLLNDNVEGVNQKEQTISLSAITSNMTFHLVCQLIGIFRPSPLIAEYSKNGAHYDAKLADVPENIKREIFDGNTKFLRRLRLLINPLEYVRVLTAQYTELSNDDHFKITKYAHLAPHYKLENKIPIIDRKRADEPILREHTIRNMDDISDFWADLRFISTFSDINIADMKELTDPYEQELRKSTHSTRNWSTKSIFSRSQRVFLNQRVDKANRKTPLYDVEEVKQIAEALQVPYEAVKSYYEKVDSALERRHRYNRNRKFERMLLGTYRKRAKSAKYDLYHGRRVISSDSSHAFDTKVKRKLKGLQTAKKEGTATATTSNKKSKGEMLYMDDMQDLPVIQDGGNHRFRKERNKRIVWTEQEDELLLYAYVILKHRQKSNGQRFSWVPVNQIFTDRNTAAGRHRMFKLLAKPTSSEKFEYYLVLWDTFYNDGLSMGEIKDETPSDNIHVDILSYIEHFVRKLQGLSENPIEFTLPRSLAETHKMYTFIRNDNTPLFEDIFHETATLVQKMQVLYHSPLTIRKYMDTMYDQSDNSIAVESDPKNRLCNAFRIYALMTLMTPAELFDPFHAFHILGKFPPQIKEIMFEKMRATRTLIVASGDRPIPGSRLALSAKFMKDMRGQLPTHMFNQAKEYEKFLDTQTEKFKFSPAQVSSGMMACLLNLLSDNQISLTMSNLNMQMKKILETGYKTRGVDISLLLLGLDIQKINQDKGQTTTDAPNSDKLNIKKLDTEEYEQELSKLLDLQDEKGRNLIKSVIDALFEQGEVGLTLYQLKTQLQDTCTDEEIMMTVHKLCFSDPALICRVGFDAVRYVHIKFVGSWSISNKNAIEYVTTAESKERIHKATDGQFKQVARKDIIIPSLWVDINGNVTDLVLNGCKEAIVDLVLRKPGISEADIYRHMSTGLSKREVRDLLNILVEQQSLRQIQVQTIPQEPKNRVSIFAKHRMVRCTNNNAIERLTQSCFWITPKTYSCM